MMVFVLLITFFFNFAHRENLMPFSWCWESGTIIRYRYYYLLLWIWSPVLLLDTGTIINFGVFWESGTIIPAVLLFDTAEYKEHDQNAFLCT